jgi:RHS repeat-associated protein
MLSDGQRTFAWDADNKPTAITLAGVGATAFGYSGDGTRVKKVGPERTIRYAGGFEDHITDGVQIKYIAAGGLQVATRVAGGINAGTYFIHPDHLGGLNVLTNSSGQEVQRLTYLPFGETFNNTGSVDFEQHRFTGQELDPETGLYYYIARYYNPVLGRFISPDAIVPEPFNPQSLNRYSYVDTVGKRLTIGTNLYQYAANNPVNRIDPLGLLDCPCGQRAELDWNCFLMGNAIGIPWNAPLAVGIGAGIKSGTPVGVGLAIASAVLLAANEAVIYNMCLRCVPE